MITQETQVRKRDGRVVAFDPSRISRAIANAFGAEQGLSKSAELHPELREEVERTTTAVMARVTETDESVDVEQIQDLVEEQLMRDGNYRVARRYIVYREEHKKARMFRGEFVDGDRPAIKVRHDNGNESFFEAWRIRRKIEAACRGLENVDPGRILDDALGSLYDGITPQQIQRATILAARSHIENDPAYGDAAARLLLGVIYREAWSEAWSEAPGEEDFEKTYRQNFEDYLQTGIEAERLSAELLEFDLDRLSTALQPDRDDDFTYLGLQTIYDRYLIEAEGRRIECPQYFWMRVAMGLSLNEDDREVRAIEFYEMLSAFRVVSATPTLFNSGTQHPQLSSCYLTTVGDDLESIFKAVSDNAKLSKWAGGLGNDWTNIRATGSVINGTGGESQGVIPFLKIFNDTAVAVNQGGKRKGAACSYMETWHLDVEDFLELRKNTGDERRRTHDMNTANWVPDLFVKRVMENGEWTLFSPNEVSDLHDLYGKAFEERYVEYERMADRGELRQYKRVEANTLWRKMLSMISETGHPWITFKDPSNVRSPQDHTGVVHSSNLCTEILLNTSAEETAVCNLCSLNLAAHTDAYGLDEEKLAETIKTAVRMLDNVVDINFYPTPEAQTANSRHRPVGLGLMGFQDALFEQRMGYASEEAVRFADYSMELISYHAILASSQLAAERGTYTSYEGSKWSRGLLPIDTIDLLEKERVAEISMDRSTTLDWQTVRDAVEENGMRNSNVMAIAPTATISNISGVYQSIEPTYSNLFVKSNLSGEFTVINPYLVRDLKKRGLWDEALIEDLKHFDGSVQDIDRVPEDLKRVYLTAFEIDSGWIIDCASRRQKWIDMGQSLNLYLAQPSGKLLSEMYLNAWNKGLKTTYYLRSRGATNVEKSSMDINKRGIQPRWMKSQSASSRLEEEQTMPVVVQQGETCSPDDPECEACQ
ncbi:ribonucleoside-diphosphate reductase subunit alpha [soil metagenome]